MKKLFKIIIITIIFFNVTHSAWADNTDKVAVFPVNSAVYGGNISIYPVAIGMIANDIANSLTTRHNINTIDGYSSQKLIKSAGLTSIYRKITENFQNTYTIDYNSCQIIADKIGANKLLLVSGGYDIQNMILEPEKLTFLSISGLQTVKPSYTLYIMLTLIDPQSGTVIWENTYKKSITSATTPAPSIYFGDNVFQTDKIKNFSYELSQKASSTIAGIILHSGYTQVNGNIISTTGQNINKPKDGITTMDGHFYSTNDDYLRSSRKENFKNWIKGIVPQ